MFVSGAMRSAFEFFHRELEKGSRGLFLNRTGREGRRARRCVPGAREPGKGDQGKSPSVES